MSRFESAEVRPSVARSLGSQAAQDRDRVACFPQAIPSNPYLRLLYSNLASHGLEQVEGARLSVGWLWSARRRVRAVHIHWPEGLFRHERGPEKLRALLSWVKLGAFVVRLLAARAFGYRVVWTVHQVLPHETTSRVRDWIAAFALGHLAHVLIAHERATAQRALGSLRVPARRLVVIPHGSYIGAYPRGRPGTEVRASLGIPESAFVFLCFGEMRAYKGIEMLLDAFGRLGPGRAVGLVVAGHPKDPVVAEQVLASAEADPRIIPILRFILPEQVTELFDACDAAVVPRGDGGTSGALVLAVSLAVPVVAAATPGNVEVLGGAQAGWFFRAGDVESLHQMLDAARADRAEARARGRAGFDVALRLSWFDIAGRTALLLSPPVSVRQ